MKVAEFLKKYPLNQERADQAVPERRVSRIVRDFSTCASCGDNVQFETQVEKSTQTVVEKGECPCCGARVPARRFRLH